MNIAQLFYILVFTLAITACSDDSWVGEEVKEGDEFRLTSSLRAHLPILLTTRADNENPLKSLRLLVFNENNQFLYSREAILGEYNSNNKSIDYTVYLIKSPKKRIIHYIANHNWQDFQQDYHLEGKDAGDILGSMMTSSRTYWQMVTLDKLDEQNIMNRDVLLISNMSTIQVKSVESTDFHLLGYKVYNSYNKGTIAPFTNEESGSLSFTTNVSEITPTLPTGHTTKDVGDLTNLDPIEIFEREAIHNNNSIYILIKGEYKGNTSYYKIDLKQVNHETGVTTLLDIIRNRLYQVNINQVDGPGFSDEESAKKAPAGNNLFASIEMADYGLVSNGKETLEISNMIETIVNSPSEFIAIVSYSGGAENLSYYPSWQSGDVYLGDLNISGTEGKIKVPVKNIPTDRTLEYTIDVVAKDPDNLKPIITRQIRLILESPYELKANYIDNPTHVSIEFKIPEKLSASAYPLDILITSNNITPAKENHMTPIIVFQDGNYSYKYTFREKPINSIVILEFTKNTSEWNYPIYITGKYFKQEGPIPSIS